MKEYKEKQVEHISQENVILSSMNKSNAVEKKVWKYHSKPTKDSKPVPTAIFHGIRQVCTETLLTNLVEQVSNGTGSYTECIEIGDGDLTSLTRSMNSQT